MENRIKKGQAMRKVNINRKELLAKLETNLIQHVENYNEAVKEYKQAALVDIQEKKNSVKKSLDELEKKVSASKTPVTLAVADNLYFEIKPPVSHEGDYKEIIQLFQWEVNDTVELDSQEFSQYILDNWSWKGELENSRTFYATKQIAFSPH